MSRPLGVKLSPRTKVVGAQLPTGTVARASISGMGRGRGTLSVDTKQNRQRAPAEVAATLRHERAHLAPKRNTVRLAERLKNPYRLGKEEGRASYLAGEPATQYGRVTGQRASSKDLAFSRGYREVRETMRRKGTKTQVNKRLSAFGIVW